MAVHFWSILFFTIWNPLLNSLTHSCAQELGPEARFYESDRARGGHTVLHERIRQTGNAVFQNLDPDGNALTMGQRYRELQELKKRPSVFLGPDGKLIDPGPAPARYSAFGSDCKENSRPGEEGRLTYECPICRKKFLKFGGVERHIKRCEWRGEGSHVVHCFALVEPVLIKFGHPLSTGFPTLLS